MKTDEEVLAELEADLKKVDTDKIVSEAEDKLSEILWHLDFVNQIPQENRDLEFLKLGNLIYKYVVDKILWEKHKSDEYAKKINKLRRRAANENKKRAERAVEFLHDVIDSDDDPFYSNLYRQLSPNVKEEIWSLIESLQTVDPTKVVNSQFANKYGVSAPRQPNKQIIEGMLKSIHSQYNITGLSDNTRELFQAINESTLIDSIKAEINDLS